MEEKGTTGFSAEETPQMDQYKKLLKRMDDLIHWQQEEKMPEDVSSSDEGLLDSLLEEAAEYINRSDDEELLDSLREEAAGYISSSNDDLLKGLLNSLLEGAAGDVSRSDDEGHLDSSLKEAAGAVGKQLSNEEPNFKDGNQDIQLTNIYISKEDNSLLDGSSDSPSPANSCHSSETEVQEEEVAEDDMTRQFLTAEERKGKLGSGVAPLKCDGSKRMVVNNMKLEGNSKPPVKKQKMAPVKKQKMAPVKKQKMAAVSSVKVKKEHDYYDPRPSLLSDRNLLIAIYENLNKLLQQRNDSQRQDELLHYQDELHHYQDELHHYQDELLHYQDELLHSINISGKDIKIEGKKESGDKGKREEPVRET